MARGYRCEAQCYRSPFGEVDLWLRRNQNEHLLIEVKTLKKDEHLPERLGRRQLRRLLNVLLWFSEKQGQNRHSIALKVIYVRPDQEWIELGIEDLIPFR